MTNLKKKMKKQEGFTLIEMLIVVAIIAILVAISIPLVGSALERAREATDASNERSFKAELTVCYLTKQAGMGAGVGDTFASNTVYVYDAPNGTISTTLDTDTLKPYGQGTASGNGKDSQARTGNYLFGYVNDDGEVKMVWSTSKPNTVDALDAITTGLTSGLLANSGT